MKTEWISVKDRLPDDDCFVIAYTKDEQIEYKYYYVEEEKQWYFEDDRGYSDTTDEPTHWMPRPAPPEVI